MKSQYNKLLVKLKKIILKNFTSEEIDKLFQWVDENEFGPYEFFGRLAEGEKTK